MNKKTKILVGSITGCALVLGAVATGLGLGLQKQEIKDTSGIETTIVEAKGMKLQLAGTEVLETGATQLTFDYTILPENATNKAITTSLAWSEDGDSSTDDDGFKSGKTVTDYVTASEDEAEQQITVTCNEAFGSQIKLTITSDDNPEATAEVNVDYRIKRTYSLDFSGHTIASNGQWSSLASGTYEESVGTLPFNGSTYTVELEGAEVNQTVNTALASYTDLLNALKTGSGASVVAEVNKLSGADYNTAVTTLNAHKTDAVTFTLSYATIETKEFVAGYDLGSTTTKVEDITVENPNIIF